MLIQLKVFVSTQDDLSEIVTNMGEKFRQDSTKMVVCCITSEGSDYLRQKEVSAVVLGSICARSAGSVRSGMGRHTFLNCCAYLALLSLNWPSSSFPWNVPCLII